MMSIISNRVSMYVRARFRLVGSEFRINALDFDMQVGGFSIFIGCRGFRGFGFLGEPISAQTCLRLAMKIAQIFLSAALHAVKIRDSHSPSLSFHHIERLFVKFA